MSMTLLEARDSRERERPGERESCGPELARRRRGGDGSRSPRARRAGAPESQPSGGMRAQEASHTPVLASELLDLLDPQPGQLAIDCTFGDGGHARLLAERLGPSGTLVAIDRDPLAE